MGLTTISNFPVLIIKILLISNIIVFSDSSTSDDPTCKIRKCCQINQSLINKKCDFDYENSANDNLAGIKLTQFKYEYDKCGNDIRPAKMNSSAVKINGNCILVYKFGEIVREFGYFEYCVDVDSVVINGTKISSSVIYLACKKTVIPDAISVTTSTTGMIISLPFLFATFVVYALLPDRNLHMKALMSYVINLMFSYIILVSNQLSKGQFSDVPCALIGYSNVFFFMASFFWMNVICFDIWFTFSGLRGHVNGKQGERRRFLIYCIYAWGMSFVHIGVVYLIDILSDRTAWYSPSIGHGQCFLQRGYPELFYFYGPMGLLIASNVILFGITAWKIYSIKKDTAVLRKEDSSKHSQDNDKQTFKLYLKLLFAMGVNWSMEITSWAVNWGVGTSNVPSAVWYLTDFCNAMYGVFIFFIFVFKRSIWKLLKRRYFSFMGRTYMAHSMSQNPTRTTNYSNSVTVMSTTEA